tara:strand:- start:540 stop:779 length:240 start_codon:yes stop_codon:yes gene_type:complete
LFLQLLGGYKAGTGVGLEEIFGGEDMCVERYRSWLPTFEKWRADTMVIEIESLLPKQMDLTTKDACLALLIPLTEVTQT